MSNDLLYLVLARSYLFLLLFPRGLEVIVELLLKPDKRILSGLSQSLQKVLVVLLESVY